MLLLFSSGALNSHLRECHQRALLTSVKAGSVANKTRCVDSYYCTIWYIELALRGHRLGYRLGPRLASLEKLNS